MYSSSCHGASQISLLLLLCCRIFFKNSSCAPANPDVTRESALHWASRSDWPRCRAGLRCCRWPQLRRAARLAALARSWWWMTSQYKPTATANTQCAEDAAVDTRVARTFYTHFCIDLRPWPRLSISGKPWSWLMIHFIHKQNITVKDQLLRKLEWKQKTDGRTRPVALPFPLMGG